MSCTTEIDLICNLKNAELSEEEDAIMVGMYYWLDGVIGATIATVGLVMNTITIFILSSKKNMQNMMNYLCSFLLTVNNIYLLTKLVNILVFDFDFNNLAVIIPYFVYPIEKTSLTMAVFCVICLAHQMYQITWDHEKYKIISSSKDSLRKRTRQYVFCVFILAFIINFPRWFSKVVYNKGERYKIGSKSLKKSFYYVVFYENFVLNILTVFVPITLLVFFNWSVRNFIQKRQREINARMSSIQLTIPNANAGEQEKEKKKKGLRNKTHTNILIIIIILFIICHFPRCLLKFLDGFLDPEPLWTKIMETLERVLLIAHASTTPFIYVIKSNKFRKYIHEMCCSSKINTTRFYTINEPKQSTPNKTQSTEMN